MADHDHGAIVIVERLHQRLTRIDIKVVRRLIEDEQMRRIAGDQRQRQPGLLAAGHLADLLLGHRAGKAEAAKLGAHRRGGSAAHQAGHMLQRRIIGIKLLHLILGEIAHAQLARRVLAAGHGGKLPGEQPRQRGLAVAVAAEQRQPVIRIQPQVDLLENGLAVIPHGGMIELHQRRLELRR